MQGLLSGLELTTGSKYRPNIFVFVLVSLQIVLMTLFWRQIFYIPEVEI